MTNRLNDLLSLSDVAGERLMTRIEGITDDEYFWEPVPDVWTVRKTDDGTMQPDHTSLPPEPAPFTTLAWRLTHIIDMLQGERTATWMRLEPADGDGSPPVPSNAAEAVDAVTHAYAVWRRRLAAVDPESLDKWMGPIAGPYAEESINAFALHILDELIHHGAEVGVVRDLYCQQRPQDPFLTACLRGDTSAVQAAIAADPDLLDRTRTQPPDLLAQAAARQDWPAVRMLAELGFAIDEPGPGSATAAHRAAGAGRIDVLEMLVEQGADLDARDGRFSATVLGWAEYFGQRETAAWLRGRDS